ncbi:MAG: hypothetical protein AAF840_08545, partial [Bacteroidota bacterium]
MGNHPNITGVERAPRTLKELTEVPNLPIKILDRDANGAVRYAKGALPKGFTNRHWAEQAAAYLQAIGIVVNETHHWRVTNIAEDGRRVHVKMQEFYHDRPVYDSGLSLHGYDGLLRSCTGRYRPEEQPASPSQIVNSASALEKAQAHLAAQTVTLSETAMAHHYLEATPKVDE